MICILQVLNDALNQRWIGVANGSVVISVNIPFNGSAVNINFTAPLAHMSIGGMCIAGCYLIVFNILYK